MEQLYNLLRSGQIKQDDILKLAERDFKAGKMSSESFIYAVKMLNFINRTAHMKDDEYINMKELIHSGIITEQELEQTLEDHKDELKGKIFNKKPIKFPDPTDAEINQYVDSDDMNKICMICCRRRKHTVFVPCGHNLLCSVCAEITATSDDTKCPICRQEIEQVQRLYA